MCVEIRGQQCGFDSLSFKGVPGIGVWSLGLHVESFHAELLTSPSSRELIGLRMCVHVPASPCRLYIDREGL